MCFNGKALYEATLKPRGVPRVAFSTPEDRAKFAVESINLLQSRCPEALVNGLVRVDIMQNENGQMVVNEFESLEADHPHGFRSINEYTELSHKLTMYYVDILLKFSNEIIIERSLK